MSEMTRKRIEWVDILKGFAILLVMLGHTKTVPAFLKIWLYSFHIPLFFFLSGYVYNSKKYKTLRSLLFQKFTTLLWPMMTYSVICGVIDCAIDSNFSFHSLLCRMVGMFIELRGSSLDSGLWFIVCLFVTEIVYWIIEKKCQYNLKRIGISVLFLGIVGTGYICFCGRIIPWALDASCIAIVFFYTGDLFKKYKEARNNSTIIFCVSFVTSVVVVFSECVYFGRTDLYANQLGFFPLYFLGGFAGIFCITIFARTIDQRLSLKLLKFIGRNSIIFYAFHKTIFKTFDLIHQKLQFNIGSIEWIVYMIAGVGFLSIISWFLKKYMGFLNRCPRGRQLERSEQ